MSEIGATLREARVRAGVDIAEIEAATKIRAKYLRALENDDWDVLPGPAYVRTFLRAYAEIVGIDPTPLLEEIRLAEAGVNADSDRPLQRRPAASPRRQRSADDERRRAGRARVSGRGGGPDRRALTRAAILVVVALLLVLAIIGLASSGDDDGGRTDTAAGDTSSVLRAQTTAGARTTTTSPSSSPSSEVDRVSLQVQPLAGRPVQVCLVDATGARRIDGATLQPGGVQPVYRSRRFKIVVGPGGASLVIGGRSRSVPSAGAGYLVTAEGRTRLNRTDWPSCGT